MRGQTPGHRKRFGITDTQDLVGNIRVISGRPEVPSHALDEVPVHGPTGVKGSLGICTDDAHRAVRDLLEEAARTGNRPASTHPGDEVGDAPGGVRPHLGSGRLIVAERAVGVRILVGLVGSGDLCHESIRHGVIRCGIVRLHLGGGNDDLGAVGPEDIPLLLANLVRDDENGAVPALMPNQGEPHARVPAGGFDDRSTWPKRTGLLGGVDDALGDAVLHRPSRVEVFDLREDGGGDPLGDMVEADEGRVSDELSDALRVPHGWDLGVLRGWDGWGDKGVG